MPSYGMDYLLLLTYHVEQLVNNEWFCWQVQWTWQSARLPHGSGDLDSDWGLSHSGSEFVCKWMTELVGGTAVECKIGGWNGAPGMNSWKTRTTATTVLFMVASVSDVSLVVSWWWLRCPPISLASNISLPWSCPSDCVIWFSNDSNFAASSCTSCACDTRPSAKLALHAALIHASNECISIATGCIMPTVHVTRVAAVSFMSCCAGIFVYTGWCSGCTVEIFVLFLFSITNWDWDNENR